MKTINLTQGQVALVDDKDYEELRRYKWHAVWHEQTHSFYARRGVWRIGKATNVYMHRQIMNAQAGQQIDHISHDTLDNRHENLRNCSNSENQQNARKGIGKTSIYKGVSWHKNHSKWAVRIKVNGSEYWLGSFADECVAGHAYDLKARALFGEFACLNFP